ncbi:MAG: molybdopterin-dependent oxidoreductase, partial [Bacteroidales bacterium]|nr:molybdopterin-dependent oxidoreductase [Bacteroidales bacterium]
DLEVDYILAAIGQKTDINFLEDVNSVVTKGELKPNKYGDIDANPNTLQTGVPSIFAAGDGVSGPATIIEAIAQANKAWVSCHQYLTGQIVEPLKKPFVSRRDNFKKQDPKDYLGRYKNQFRQEMPVLDPKNRVNYKEVELGYTDESVAKTEAARCFECGCSEYFDCDLQQFADKYGADQKYYAGEFKQYDIDFSHPLIEIDNNKCILCAKCIRVCNEVVGAKALGLVNRGFETFVAPSMNKRLTDTNCESCGMCISICPTGAITENVPFKTMPLKPDKIQTIDCFSSEGASIELLHKAGFIFRAEGIPGLVNQKASIGKQAKFGYRLFNQLDRITKPMLKQNGEWKEIEFDEAFSLIKNKLNGHEQNTVVTASGRMTNEELYLSQKFVRQVLKTNNICSLNYIGRGPGYLYNSNKNLSLSDLQEASKIIIFGSDLNYDNSLVNHMIFNAKYRKGIEIILITDKENAKIAYKCDKIIKVKSYYKFVKSMNKIVLDNNWQNNFFIASNVDGLDEYKKNLSACDLNTMISESGQNADELKHFTEMYNLEQNAVIVFQEKEVTSATAQEIINLSNLTGKTGKTGSGILAVKEKNNSQGLIDMGIRPNLLPGAVKTNESCITDKINNGGFTHFVLLGEDPIGQAKNKAEVEKWFAKREFVVVQDFFMTETAKMADLVLPASFHFETGGSFTNTQKVIQQFEKSQQPRCRQDNLQQFSGIFKAFGVNQSSDACEVWNEIAEKLAKVSEYKLYFEKTDKDSNTGHFVNTCDILLEKLNDIIEF